MSIGFKPVQDSIVIIRQKTVYKQCKAYIRKGNVYANAAGGFIKLREDGATTPPHITWEDIEGVEGVVKKKQSGKYLEAKDATE